MKGYQAAMKEHGTHMAGRDGSAAVKRKPGPAAGKTSGNSTKGGGINRSLKSSGNSALGS